MHEHTWPAFCEGEADSEPLRSVRVNRQTLVEIATDREVLGVLLRAAYSTSDLRSTEELVARVLMFVFTVIPARRGAFVLLNREQDDFTSATYRPRSFEIPRPVVRRALQDRAAVWGGEATPRLCVPLRAFDRMLGVIYIEAAPGTVFETRHVHLAIAIASVAALSLQHTAYVESVEGENRRLNEEIDIQSEIVGRSPGMNDVYQFIRKAAPKKATVLILGESGTGKELVARALHRNSERRDAPFVAVNCAAIVESLLESELFGNERGAFTGAMEQRKGKIEAADGGTLFLDEVGELTMSVQAALLRFLQELVFYRVGGSRPIRADVRIVAATNRNLEQRIREGRFRHDLYFRLNVLQVRMPSLAQRRDDIPLLTDHFIRKYRHIRVVNRIAPKAQRLLMSYDWPGNVRELENAVQSALSMGETDEILPEDLPEALTETKAPETARPTGFHASVNYAKKMSIVEAIEHTQGNVAEAARRLEVSESYLYRMIRKLSIDVS